MKHFKRTLSIVLSVAMLLQMGITPAFAVEATTTTKTVTAFAELTEDEKSITLPLGSTEDEVKAALPKTLTATVETVTDEGSMPKPPAQDSGQPPVQEVTPGEDGDTNAPPAEEVTPDEDGDTNAPPAEEKIPDEDGDTNAPPAEEELPNEDGIATPGNATETVQSFSVRGTTAIGLSTVSGQPTGTDAEPAKSTTTEEQVAVTWLLAEGEVFSPETAGAFTYTASLSGSGYTLAEGVRLPEITVTLEANRMMRSAGAIYHVDTSYTGSDSDGSEEKPYATLAAAYTAIGGTDGCTIKLLSDIDLGSELFRVWAASLTLDLNGKTLTSANDSRTLSCYGVKTLTVQDSSATGSSPGTGKVKNTSAQGYAIHLPDAGTAATNRLVVTGGTLEAADTAIYNNSTGGVSISGGTVLGAGSGTIYNGSTGALTISGGTVLGTGPNTIYNYSTGKITISGTAKVSSAGDYTIQLGGSGTETADRLVITGGTVENTGSGRAIINNSVGGVEISGGTVSADKRLAIENSNTGKITISGTAKVSSAGDYTIQLGGSGTETADRLEITGGTVENTGNGLAIWNSSTGGVSITGGTVVGAGSSTINNYSTGGVSISGGTVENTGTGTAVANESSGLVTISGTARIIGANGNAVALVDSATETADRLVVSGGTLEAADTAIYNGSAGGVSISGGTVLGTGPNTIYNYSTGALTISGGAVVNSNGKGAVWNRSTGTVTYTGGLIWGDCSGAGTPAGMAWSVKGAETLPVNATLPADKVFTIPADAALTIAQGVTLTNSGAITSQGTLTNNGTFTSTGTLTNNGTFTSTGTATGTGYGGTGTVALAESFIKLPSNLVYNGTAKEITVSILDHVFVPTTDYTVAYSPDNIKVGEVTATVATVSGSKLTGTPVEKKFTIAQFGTEFDGGITTDKTDKTYTYGETITVTVTPKATGAAPATRRAAPTAGQMALFLGDTQVSDAAGAVSGTYTMTIDTKDKTLAAGSNTITAKYVGTTSMADYSETVTVTLNPKPIASATVNAGAAKAYDGTAAFTGVALTPNAADIFGGDTVTATAAGNAAGANASTHSFATTEVTLSGAQGSYYSLAPSAVSGNVEITAIYPSYDVAAQKIKIKNSLTAVQRLQSATGVSNETVEGVLTWSKTSGGAALDDTFTFEGSAGDVITLYWTFAPTSGNYKALSDSTAFTLTTKDVPILTVNNISKTYDGTAVTTVSGTAAKADGTGIPGTFAFGMAPLMKDAGNYTAVVNFTPTDTTTYETASIVIIVIIEKATITIKAKDKAAYVGDSVPTFSDADYTVSGLGSGETLTTLPSLDYAATPDMSKAGSVAIIASGAAAPDGRNYNDIVYQPGTLTISTKGGGGGGGSGGGGSTPTPPITPETPTTPTTVETGVNSKTDKDGNATATVADKDITNAIDKAQKEAKKNGTEKNGIAITLNVKTDKNATTLSVTLTQKSIAELIAAKVTQVTVNNGLSTIILDLAALKALAGGDVVLTVSKMDVKTLSAEAQNAIGNRPVFRFGATVGGKAVTDFKAGRVGLQMPYTRSTTEQVGNLCAVYVDGNGKVNWLENSSYDPITSMMLASTSHFSIYGVGYKQSTPKFTDVGTHWAKNDIDFVVARGLLSGTSNTTFAPETSMTRGMFVTALGRLAGVDTKKYSTTKFTDVKTDAYYAPYVAWANANNIVNGTSDTTFDPDKAISRQEMAVMLVNYSKTIGYKLPSVHAQVTFTDASSIASWAKDAVGQMQMAGILMGKSGNRFDPTATATRAEVSAMLRRYVELVVSTETAEGWAMNESGQWMYIQDGKRITGKKSIDGTAYTFDQYGVTTALPPERKYGTHIVQRGESFWGIAWKYKVSMFELAKVNGKTIFSIIYTGDELKIPQK